MESSEFESIMAKGYNKEKLEIEFHQNLLDSTDWKEHVCVTYSLDLTIHSFLFEKNKNERIYCYYMMLRSLPNWANGVKCSGRTFKNS